MKTRDEVEALKRNWVNDPCWDLGSTEGFESYSEELSQYELYMETQWGTDYMVKIEKFADKLGVPEKLGLAEYLIDLSRSVKALEVRLEAMQERLNALENATQPVVRRY